MLKGRELSDRSLQLDALDGLRGLAALIVFAAHASNARMHLLPPLDLSGNGKSGVFLFFVLSAFLLTRPFLTGGAAKYTVASLLSYLARRCTRVYPLYAVYLLSCVVSTATVWRILGLPEPQGIPMTLSTEQAIRHFTLLEGIGVTWSIAVEFKYYFLLPVVAAILAACRHRLPAAGFLIVASIGACLWAWPDSAYRGDDVRLGFYLPAFLVGSFLALVEFRLRTSAPALFQGVPKVADGLALAAAAGLFLMVPSVASWTTGRELDPGAFHRQVVPFAVLWGFVLLATVISRGWVHRAMNLPWLRFFGFISFSFYLVHPLFIEVGKLLVSRQAVHPTLAAWLSLAACTLASWLSFRLIERPSSRWRLGFGGRMAGLEQQ